MCSLFYLLSVLLSPSERATAFNLESTESHLAIGEMDAAREEGILSNLSALILNQEAQLQVPNPFRHPRNNLFTAT